MKEKKIKKVVVFYEDGTFQEIESAIPPSVFPPYQTPFTAAPVNPFSMPKVTCFGNAEATSTVYQDPTHD